MGEVTDRPTVRVRGMYATAISVACRAAGMAIADPSPVLRERLEGPFAADPPDVRVSDGPDRMGLEISGNPDAVPAVGEQLAGCSIDSLRWSATLPRGGIFRIEIDEEGDGGAIAKTGEGAAFLPYGKVDGYVTEGDRLTAQVIDPEPPWSVGRRPLLGGGIRATGAFLSAERGAESDIARTPSPEAAQMVERLGIDPPPGWGLVLRDRTEDAEPARLRTDLEAVVDRAQSIEDAIEEGTPEDVGRVFAPDATAWVRLGREGRFAMDTHRETVATTVDGHHRIKTIGEGAARAVDLLEAYGLNEVTFDPDVILGVFGPDEGDRVRIEHGKPTGETIELGHGEVLEMDKDGEVVVRRRIAGSGTYDALETPREAGDQAETTFVEGRWWYPTVYRSAEGEYKGTYVNVGTPIEILPDRVRYVDLYVDVIRTPEGDVTMVDGDELDAAVDAGAVPEPLGQRARDVAEAVASAF